MSDLSTLDFDPDVEAVWSGTDLSGRTSDPVWLPPGTTDRRSSSREGSEEEPVEVVRDGRSRPGYHDWLLANDKIEAVDVGIDLSMLTKSERPFGERLPLLAGKRVAYGDTRPLLCTARFLAVSVAGDERKKSTAHRMLRKLKESGQITEDGTLPGHGKRRPILYGVPGWLGAQVEVQRAFGNPLPPALAEVLGPGAAIDGRCPPKLRGVLHRALVKAQVSRHGAAVWLALVSAQMVRDAAEARTISDSGVYGPLTVSPADRDAVLDELVRLAPKRQRTRDGRRRRDDFTVREVKTISMWASKTVFGHWHDRFMAAWSPGDRAESGEAVRLARRRRRRRRPVSVDGLAA